MVWNYTEQILRFTFVIYALGIPCLQQAVIVFKCIQYTTKHENEPEIFPVWADVIWWLIVAGAIISIPVWCLGYICYKGGARFDLLFVLILLLFFSFHCSNIKNNENCFNYPNSKQSRKYVFSLANTVDKTLFYILFYYHYWYNTRERYQCVLYIFIAYILICCLPIYLSKYKTMNLAYVAAIRGVKNSLYKALLMNRTE